MIFKFLWLLFNLQLKKLQKKYANIFSSKILLLFDQNPVSKRNLNKVYYFTRSSFCSFESLLGTQLDNSTDSNFFRFCFKSPTAHVRGCLERVHQVHKLYKPNKLSIAFLLSKFQIYAVLMLHIYVVSDGFAYFILPVTENTLFFCVFPVWILKKQTNKTIQTFIIFQPIFVFKFHPSRLESASESFANHKQISLVTFVSS